MEDRNKLIIIGVSLVVLAVIVAAVLIPKGGGDDESTAPAQAVTKEGNLDEPTPTVEKGESASVTMETPSAVPVPGAWINCPSKSKPGVRTMASPK